MTPTDAQVAAAPCPHGVELDMCDTYECAQRLNMVLPGMPSPRPPVSAADSPVRIRVWGGRSTHAARQRPADQAGRDGYEYRTACGRGCRVDGRLADHLLDPGTPVTCVACKRALGLEEA